MADIISFNNLNNNSRNVYNIFTQIDKCAYRKLKNKNLFSSTLSIFGIEKILEIFMSKLYT